jgi:protein-tyrosine-phosphatase
MAAGLLRHALAAQPEPLRSLEVISAGVSARSGDRVTEYSAAILKKVGIDISRHTSQPVTQALLDGATAVFVMTESHRVMIQATANPVPRHLYLFREFMPADKRVGDKAPRPVDREIPDPYGGPLSAYETARDEMVEALPSVVEFLKSAV